MAEISDKNPSWVDFTIILWAAFVRAQIYAAFLVYYVLHSELKLGVTSSSLHQ